jgi:hypothetical protein
MTDTNLRILLNSAWENIIENPKYSQKMCNEYTLQIILLHLQKVIVCLLVSSSRHFFAHLLHMSYRYWFVHQLHVHVAFLPFVSCTHSAHI